MKKITSYILVFFALFFLAACGNEENAAADELIEYYNEEWIPILAMKSEKMKETQDTFLEIHDGPGEEEEKDEETIALYKDEIIPIADDVLEQLKSVELEHKEVEKMNDLQIEAEEFSKVLLENSIDLFEGTISEAELKQDEENLKKKYDDVLDYRDELMEEYGLEFDEEQGEIEGFYELKYIEE